MKNPSYPIRTPRAAGLCLAALLLAPAIAPAQIGAGALTGTNTYEGREEGEVIAINLTTGSFGETLPFDVTFKVAGEMPKRFGRGSRVDARFVEFKRPPDCASFFNQYTLTRQPLTDLNETDSIPVRRRQRSLATETSGFRQATIFTASGATLDASMVPIGDRGQTPGNPDETLQGASFLVDFPALRPNHYYCFQFISRRALSKKDLEMLHQAFEKTVDAELRKSKYRESFDGIETFVVSVEDYESLRVALSATIEAQLANEDQVVLAPPNSFFNVGARLEDITLKYREQFEDIAERTVEGRLTAVKAFNESVGNAVGILLEMADRKFEVTTEQDGQQLKGTLTGRQLVLRSANAEVRTLGSELLGLSPEQMEDRFKGVPADMPLAPPIEEAWTIVDETGKDDAVLSLQERIENIQALASFIDTLAEAAAARQISLTGAQTNVRPLGGEDVTQTNKDLAKLQALLDRLVANRDPDAEDTPSITNLRERIKQKEAQLARQQGRVASGDTAPQVNLLSEAAGHLGDAVTQLRLLQEVLQQRSALISEWVRQVLVEEQASLVVGATTVADYDTRAIWYMSADIGSGISELEDFFTYVGWNIYLRPVNKKSHLSWTARPFGLGEEILRRFSFTLGVVQTGFDEKDGQFTGVVGGNAAVLGAGMRINDSLRFSVGGMLFESQDPDPLVDSSKLEWSPYVAISLDWNIGASFSGLLGGGG